MGLTRDDPYRDHQQEYLATEQPRLLQTAPGLYLTFTGHSKPGSEDFRTRVRVLFKTARRLLKLKQHAGHDFHLGKLEMLWWPKGKDKDSDEQVWYWKLLLRLPEHVTEKELQAAKHETGDPLTEGIWLERLDEGEVIQALHVGPYDNEQQTLDRMRDFARRNGRSFEGFHHEIYLTNPSDVPPEKLRTILRQHVVSAPVAP